MVYSFLPPALTFFLPAAFTTFPWCYLPCCLRESFPSLDETEKLAWSRVPFSLSFSIALWGRSPSYWNCPFLGRKGFTMAIRLSGPHGDSSWILRPILWFLQGKCVLHSHPSWLQSPWLLSHIGSHNLQQLSKLVVNCSCSFMASSSFCSRQTTIRCIPLQILDVCPISVLLRGLRKGIDFVWAVCLMKKWKC